MRISSIKIDFDGNLILKIFFEKNVKVRVKKNRVVAWNLGGIAAGIMSWKTKTKRYKTVRRAKRAKRVKKF